MTWEVVVGLLQVAVGSVAVFSLIYAIKSLRFARDSFAKQMNVQIFLAYNQRFEAIMEACPDSIRSAGLHTDFQQLDPSKGEAARAWMVKYLNLCSEEYHLLEQEFIPSEVWMIWEKEIERTLRSKLYRSAWPEMKEEYKSHETFCKFVQDALDRGNGGKA